jgi:hypothetical protein
VKHNLKYIPSVREYAMYLNMEKFYCGNPHKETPIITCLREFRIRIPVVPVSFKIKIPVVPVSFNIKIHQEENNF